RYRVLEALKLSHATAFFLPIAFDVEEPILDTPITHLQRLGEAFVNRVPRTLDRYWRSDVESASRVHWSKRWRVRYGFQSEKRQIVVLVLVRVTKSGQNSEALQRH